MSHYLFLLPLGLLCWYCYVYLCVSSFGYRSSQPEQSSRVGWMGIESSVMFSLIAVCLLSCRISRYSDVVGSVKGLVEDSHRFVGTAPVSQP